MLLKRIYTVAFLAMFAGGALLAQDFKYIGAPKCKMCHNKPEKGEQYNKWMAAPHANAMKSLGNEKSIAYAKANGIADPTKEASCLKCHSTFHQVAPNLRAGITESEGVSCESCHGPGSMYKGASVMKNRELSMQKGLILPTKEVCETCHNEDNPFHKPFDYAAASAKIAHPDPALSK